MSIIAGIFCRKPGGGVPSHLKRDLLLSVSRNPTDRAEVFEDGQCFLAKLDFDVFGSPAFHRNGGGATAILAGHLGLQGDGSAGDRSQQLSKLARQWIRGGWSALRDAEGSFCLAHYDPTKGRLTLATDKVGVRGLFFWAGPEYVVFASGLRILEGISGVPKRMDLRGTAEMAAFGYPLGDRTPYADIVRLRGGELAEFSESSLSRSYYWKWEQVPNSSEPESELLQLAYRQFLRAVETRAGKDTGVASFLSGGLDSRCIVAALRVLGRNVWTCNIGMPGTLDEVLARSFAQAVQAFHTEWGGDAPAGHVVSSYAALLKSCAPPPFAVERPGMIWSGDGGSVGLGHVYISALTADCLASGRRPEAIGSFLAEVGADLPKKLLKPSFRDDLADIVSAGVSEELDEVCQADAVRQFHIFLLNNDQRWHLFNPQEDIDLHRIELQLPFFDGAFLATVMSIPGQQCLGHKFYQKWLALFPGETTSVAWQTYPGHETCPLPIPSHLTYQWSTAFAGRAKELQRASLLSQGRVALENFPSAILDKSLFRVCLLLHKARIRDYSYMIAAASTFQKYWSISGGVIAPPTGRPYHARTREA